LNLKAEAADIRARLKDKTLEGWQRQRLQAVLLGMEAHNSLPEIASQVGAGARTISTWFDLFREGGFERLLSRESPGGGNASWLDDKTAEEFKKKLAEAKWRRAAEVREWLQQQLGRELSMPVVYKYLGKAQARLKVPRPTHAAKDPAAAEAFRATLSERLHAEGIELNVSVHLWVSDEMRYGLQPLTRRIWTLRGVDPKVEVQPRYQWGYTYGALEVCADGAEFLHTDGVSQEASACFLEQISKSDPDAMHLVIQDGAGFHLETGDKRVPANVRLITLPAYSPELNPIEQLWDIIQDRICNRRWEDLPALEAAINVALQEYWSTPAKVRSLIGENWLSDQANASSRSVLAA
jgi:transposase